VQFALNNKEKYDQRVENEDPQLLENVSFTPWPSRCPKCKDVPFKSPSCPSCNVEGSPCPMCPWLSTVLGLPCRECKIERTRWYEPVLEQDPVQGEEVEEEG